MTEEPRISTEPRAASFVCDLLTRSYREVWLPYCKRHRQGLSQAAVATVLSKHLWETGQASELDIALPRRLKDRVSRALSGRSLPPTMLQLIIEAFGISDAEARTAWSLLLDEDPDPSVALPPAVPLTGRVSPRSAAAYQTVSAHDFHRLGPDGRPVEHRTVQVIRAHAPVANLQCRFDGDVTAVQVLRGGSAADMTPSGIPDLHAVDITLTEPLQPGETASLEYQVLFAHEHPPKPLVRRVSRNEAKNVTVHVAFHPRCRPRRLEWCRWSADRLGSGPLSAEPVTPNADGEAHRYLGAISGEGVGFRWEW
ncbi:hypothetical protein IM660_03210 [Ruania alkalisoli]|uniref:Uncharacterized protein n=1 Tax=Ruania alkalisoli TaxID=2779775 RepID=A0A7M1SUW3_9MICO|nr:hypothetical protein [Ruania alkalisoli]QOR71325.1 hypothetical protein IM660_03210 [Ruania alkalisoli]